MRSFGLGQLAGEFGMEIAERIWRMPPDQQGCAVGFVRDEIARERRRFGLGSTDAEMQEASGTNWPTGLPSWVYAAARAEIAQGATTTGMTLGGQKYKVADMNDVPDPRTETIARITPPSAPADSVASIKKIRELFTKSGVAGPVVDLLNPISQAAQTIIGIVYADAEADLMGRSWDYDVKLQQAKLDILNAALDALRDSMATPPPTPIASKSPAIATGFVSTPMASRIPTLAAKFVSTPMTQAVATAAILTDTDQALLKAVIAATIALRATYPKSASDLAKGTMWVEMARAGVQGLATLAAMVSGLLSGGPIGMFLAMGSIVAGEVAKSKAEDVAQAQWNKAVEAQVVAERTAATSGAAAAATTPQTPPEPSVMAENAPMIYGAIAVAGLLLFGGKLPR